MNQVIKKISARTISFACLLTLVSCGGSHSGKIPQGGNSAYAASAERLAPGDVVKLNFPGAPNYDQTQRIRADGMLSLPVLGEVKAGGKQFGAFQKELADRYKTELKLSEVIVTLEAPSATVTVTGAVVKVGKVALDRPMTLFDAIEEAGGGNNIANKKRVVVVRNVNGKHFSQEFDLTSPEKGRPAEAFYLKPNDRIIVPERFF